MDRKDPTSIVLPAGTVLVDLPGLDGAAPKPREIEIRANKRLLAKRRRELLGMYRSLAEIHELTAVEMAIEALSTPTTAKRLRDDLKNRAIMIVGGLAGGVGSAESTIYTVVAPPRRRRGPEAANALDKRRDAKKR